jgi:hypothetical protein
MQRQSRGRPLGINLLRFPIGSEEIDLETDLYGVYQWEPTYPRLTTLRQLHKHLTEMRTYHGECRVYSERRNRCVPFYRGCFACSGRCYKDIVNALWLWEGPSEEQQVVVITATTQETSYLDSGGLDQAHAQVGPQWEMEYRQLHNHHQRAPKSSKRQRKKLQKQLENKLRRKREKKRRNREKRREKKNNSRCARVTSRNGN